MTTALQHILRLFLVGAALLVAVNAQTPGSAGKSTPAKPTVAYTLMTSDKLNIRIFQETDLDIISRIDAKGCVNLTLVGDVHVAGLTRSEAEKAVENAYRDGRYLRNPQVTITIEEHAQRAVTVYGPVKHSGQRIPLQPDEATDLVDIISKAGGFLDTAKGNAVMVTRIGPDGERISLGPFDVQAVIKGKDRGKKAETVLIMMPDDIVNVPMKMF